MTILFFLNGLNNILFDKEEVISFNLVIEKQGRDKLNALEAVYKMDIDGNNDGWDKAPGL